MVFHPHELRYPEAKMLLLLFAFLAFLETCWKVIVFGWRLAVRCVSYAFEYMLHVGNMKKKLHLPYNHLSNVGTYSIHGAFG